MSTKLNLFTFLIRFSLTSMIERYMIPSYNIEVKSKANFYEQQNQMLPIQLPSVNKTVCVQGKSPSSPTGIPCAKVWVYSLDMQDVLGPFDLTAGHLLKVIIDERAWGVYSEASMELIMDVWIDRGS
jgi:hypothetical protein